MRWRVGAKGSIIPDRATGSAKRALAQSGRRLGDDLAIRLARTCARNATSRVAIDGADRAAPMYSAGRSCFDSRTPSTVGGLSVGILPAETTVLEIHGRPVDVVAEPKAVPSNAVLPFSSGDLIQLLDWVAAATVVGVGAQDGEDVRLVRCQLGMPFEKSPVISLEASRDVDRKKRRHGS